MYILRDVQTCFGFKKQMVRKRERNLLANYSKSLFTQHFKLQSMESHLVSYDHAMF